MNVTIFPIRFWSWVIKNRKQPKPNFMTEPLRQVFRVLPSDVDINMHLNNARYLRFMEIGRWSLLARQKLLKPAFQKGYAGIVAGIQMRYRRSLKPFEKFTLVTQIYDWDEKWFYIRQYFLNSQQKISAIGTVRIVFLHKGKAVSTDTFLQDFDMIFPPRIEKKDMMDMQKIDQTLISYVQSTEDHKVKDKTA